MDRGYCPYYDLLLSLWGQVVKQPNNYRSNQLVKEEDIVVNKDLFLINAETGSLYFAGGGTYAQIPAIDGHEDFIKEQEEVKQLEHCLCLEDCM